jgi:hypothetical protein
MCRVHVKDISALWRRKALRRWQKQALNECNDEQGAVEEEKGVLTSLVRTEGADKRPAPLMTEGVADLAREVL